MRIKELRKYYERRELSSIMEAVIIPFGSLQSADGTLRARVARAVEGWVWSGPGERRGAAGELMETIGLTDEEQHSEVRLLPGEVTLVTPTSSTRIHVTRTRVTVFFGDEGSVVRATQILESALLNSVLLEVRDTAGHLVLLQEQRELVRQRLLSMHQWLKWRPDGYYSAEVLKELLASCEQKLARFEAAE